MIIEKILSAFTGMLCGIFKLFKIPNLPEALINSVHSFLDFLFSNSSLLGLFIKIDTLKTCAGILIILINFDKIYSISKWLLSKVPFLNK